MCVCVQAMRARTLRLTVVSRASVVLSASVSRRGVTDVQGLEPCAGPPQLWRCNRVVVGRTALCDSGGQDMRCEQKCSEGWGKECR